MGGAERDLSTAVQDFWRARRRAQLQEALSFLRRDRGALLSYEDVRRKLRGVEDATRTLEEVPLDAIVGSVGRYNDFTRGFLPRQDSDKQRWAGVLQAMTGMRGVPPIEVYRIGDAYFVKDGNHRVSVARQLGAKYLQAYVTPVHSKVRLEPDDDPDDLIIKAELADFLLETRLDELRPEADLTVTVPGQYQELLEHISVHRYFMGIDQGREVSYPEAVAHWYDVVYTPVVRAIRDNNLLAGFPGRTETDLYLWLSKHRSELEKELGWSLSTETVAQGLAEEVAGEQNPSPGRRERVLRAAVSREPTFELLCEDVLLALPDLAGGMTALEQALLIARREGSRLYGLHVPARNGSAGGREASSTAEVEELRRVFQARCREAGVPAQFAVAAGDPGENLLERATWSDLVVAPLPVGEGGAANLTNGYRSFLRRSPRPVVTVPGAASEFRRILLAYDGGARADAALFIGAYLAAKWGSELLVYTVSDLAQVLSPPLEQARSYLEAHGIEATYVTGRGRVGPAIVDAAGSYDCDAVLMGSYKYSRWLESVLGGVVEEVLKSFPGPVLVA